MTRATALVLSLAIGASAFLGVFALTRTAALSRSSHAASNALVAKRTQALDRYEAALRKALARTPPALPPVSTARPAMPAQAVRVVYHRPPPVVVTVHRAGAEHESDGSESGFDD
jgi:hypothetical protein